MYSLAIGTACMLLIGYITEEIYILPTQIIPELEDLEDSFNSIDNQVMPAHDLRILGLVQHLGSKLDHLILAPQALALSISGCRPVTKYLQARNRRLAAG